MSEQEVGSRLKRLAIQRAGTTEREMGSEIETTAETAGTALAAQARAMVEARFFMAFRRPRDWDDVRTRLKAACERPGFAGSATEKVWGSAWYNKPVGDGVEGFSIRFAEEAVRAMGNIDVQTVTVFDNDEKRVITVTVTDLESNNSYPTSITLMKTVERRFLKKGQTAIKVRLNSEDKATYIVEATEDEVFQKQQSAASKAIRNGVLRLLPGDIQAECRDRIIAIRQGDIAKDPDKVRKEIADAFAGLNVQPSGLKDLLGHELAASTPAELAFLRDLYKAIKAGEITWQETLDAHRAERGEPTSSEQTTEKPKGGLDAISERIKAAAAAKKTTLNGTTPTVTDTTATPAVETVVAEGPRPTVTVPAETTPPTKERIVGEDDEDESSMFRIGE